MIDWLRVWVHCLGRTFARPAGTHRMCTHEWRIRGVRHAKHYCECGFNA